MLTIYDASTLPLKRALTNLSHILKKAEAHAEAKNIDPSIFVNARLFPDMYPLSRQVQIATDMTKGALARLADVEIPKYEDNETTFAELQARIAKTIHFINSILPEQLVGSEARDVVINVRKVDIRFKGHAYLLNWVMPNVYFHITTAYNILRHNGVDLGKSDFLGDMA